MSTLGPCDDASLSHHVGGTMVGEIQCHKGLASLKVTYANRAEIIVKLVGNNVIGVTRKTAALLGGDILFIKHFFSVKSHPVIVHRAEMSHCEHSYETVLIFFFFIEVSHAPDAKHGSGTSCLGTNTHARTRKLQLLSNLSRLLALRRAETRIDPRRG